jgi:hypothetical protein
MSDKGWCPWWHEVCEEGLTETMLKKTKKGKVPIRCRMWKKVTGNDPQSGAAVDRWDCSVGWMTTLQLEQARVNFSLGAAVESLRNRVCDMAQALGSVARVIPLLADGKSIIMVDEVRKDVLEHKGDSKG